MQGNGISGFIADARIVGKGPEGDFVLNRTERVSPTLGARPPRGATVLFDGSNLNEWTNGKIVEGNLLFCGAATQKPLGTGELHLEFRTPFQPQARGQGRGNSGVFVRGSEVQILDSFGLLGASTECGGIFGKTKPAVHMCLPPLAWQTYDIDIRTNQGKTLLTVLHNGVKIHDNLELRDAPATPTVMSLQDHRNYVVFRNIWFLGTGRRE
jgi:hypothetical protein